MPVRRLRRELLHPPLITVRVVEVHDRPDELVPLERERGEVRRERRVAHPLGDPVLERLRRAARPLAERVLDDLIDRSVVSPVAVGADRDALGRCRGRRRAVVEPDLQEPGGLGRLVAVAAEQVRGREVRIGHHLAHHRLAGLARPALGPGEERQAEPTAAVARADVGLGARPVDVRPTDERVAFEHDAAVPSDVVPGASERHLDVAGVDLGHAVEVELAGGDELGDRIHVRARRGARGQPDGEAETGVHPGQGTGAIGPGRTSKVSHTRWGTPSASQIGTSESFANTTSAYSAPYRSDCPSPTNATGPWLAWNRWTASILHVPQPTHPGWPFGWRSSGRLSPNASSFVTTGTWPSPAASRIGLM